MNMKKKNKLILFSVIAVMIICVILTFFIKCFIDLLIYDACMNHDPSIFNTHPICQKYKDY